MYEFLAPYYRKISEMRAAYIDGVDRIILSNIAAGAGSFLDVGAADGIRAARLAKSAGFSSFVLVEPSLAMAIRCRSLPNAGVLQVRAEEMIVPQSFDVITCLWNVLGHVETAALRLEALRRMRAALAPGGRLFVDVNNRYNALSYGWLKTLGRLVRDAVDPADDSGDVEFVWRLQDQSIPGKGHVFTPAEMRRLLRAAALHVERRYVIDYQTGEPRRFWFQGQLLYELSRT